MTLPFALANNRSVHFPLNFYRLLFRFRSSDGNALISAVQNEVLTGELYDAATAQNLSTRVAEEVRSRLKALHLEHYKYLVQVNLSEQRGQSAQ